MSKKAWIAISERLIVSFIFGIVLRLRGIHLSPFEILGLILIVSLAISLLSLLALLVTNFTKIVSSRKRRRDLIENQKLLLKELSIPSKMEVNAAIEQTIETSMADPAVAKPIVIFGCSVPVQAQVRRERNKTTRQDSKFTGLTEEAGEIGFQDTRETTTTTGFGIRRERVGHYKLSRGVAQICIQQFWKADLTTSIDLDDSPPIYILYFVPETLEPWGFGMIEAGRSWKFRHGRSTTIITRQQVRLLNPGHAGQTIPHGWQWFTKKVI